MGSCLCFLFIAQVPNKHEWILTYFDTTSIHNFLGSTSSSNWGISSIFGGGESRTTVKESPMNKTYNEPIHTTDQAFSMIQLREVIKYFPIRFSCASI